MMATKKATKKASTKKATKKAAPRKKTPKKKTARRTETFDDSHGDQYIKGLANNRLVAMLQYFFPLGLIWYLVDEKMKKDMFVKFHLKQSLVVLAGYIAWRIICELLWVIVGSFGWAVNLFLAILAIVGIIHAYKGEEKRVPLIGGFSRYLKF